MDFRGNWWPTLETKLDAEVWIFKRVDPDADFREAGGARPAADSERQTRKGTAGYREQKSDARGGVEAASR